MGCANQSRLGQRVVRAAEEAVAERHYVTAIDVLVGIGWLMPTLLEDWRRGRIPYLERALGANLHKITTAMRFFRRWAEQQGLTPSETAYVAWTPDRHPLRFSKSGDPTIEGAYRPHWVSPELREAKRQRLAERRSGPPERRATRLAAGPSTRSLWPQPPRSHYGNSGRSTASRASDSLR